jgi:hypothetical protein
VKIAVENLESFDAARAEELRTLNGQILMLVALAYLTLEELASQEANSRLQKTIDELQTTLYTKPSKLSDLRRLETPYR